jgi:pimeloyl-ACP methyl ester carboxylesterase
MRNSMSPFKSEKGETKYMAAYEALTRRWPVPYEPMDITSRFGQTHLVVSGPKDAPALVLLHGYAGTLNMWLPNIADLTKQFRVYAVDVMGQPGKTIPDPTHPIRSRADFVAWLTLTLNALQIDRAYLVGMSYGGWLALNYAIAAPERVKKLALLSAAGFVPLSRQFAFRTMIATLCPTRFTVKSLMNWITYKHNLSRPDMRELNHDVVELMYLGLKYFRFQRETLVESLPFSDDELRALKVPTLLLIGQQEVICDSVAALNRARRLIPEFHGELVSGASHDMSYNRHYVVDVAILDHFAESLSVSSSFAA